MQLRPLGNTGNWAGTTRWRTATLSFSNSTHPVHLKRSHENTKSPEGELRILFSRASKSDTVCWFSYLSFKIQRIIGSAVIYSAGLIWHLLELFNTITFPYKLTSLPIISSILCTSQIFVIKKKHILAFMVIDKNRYNWTEECIISDLTRNSQLRN